VRRARGFSWKRGSSAGQDDLGVLLQRNLQDVLDTIKSDAQLQAGDRRKYLALAEQKVLPHIDFRGAAQMATGKAWQAAR